MASCKDFSCGPLDFKLGSDIAFCGMIHKLCISWSLHLKVIIINNQDGYADSTRQCEQYNHHSNGTKLQ